jgi:hypothetical protein
LAAMRISFWLIARDANSSCYLGNEKLASGARRNPAVRNSLEKIPYSGCAVTFAPCREKTHACRGGLI